MTVASQLQSMHAITARQFVGMNNLINWLSRRPPHTMKVIDKPVPGVQLDQTQAELFSLSMDEAGLLLTKAPTTPEWIDIFPASSLTLHPQSNTISILTSEVKISTADIVAPMVIVLETCQTVIDTIIESGYQTIGFGINKGGKPIRAPIMTPIFIDDGKGTAA